MEKAKNEIVEGACYLIVEVVIVALMILFTEGWIWLSLKVFLIFRTCKEFVFWQWDLRDFISDHKIDKISN